MKRIVITAAGLALTAAALTGCSSARVTRSYGHNAFAKNMRNEAGRLNVGAGDALGMAVFGQQITLARAEQFGDYEYAAYIEGFEQD